MGHALNGICIPRHEHCLKATGVNKCISGMTVPERRALGDSVQYPLVIYDCDNAYSWLTLCDDLPLDQSARASVLKYVSHLQ